MSIQAYLAAADHKQALSLNIEHRLLFFSFLHYIVLLVRGFAPAMQFVDILFPFVKMLESHQQLQRF